VGRAVDRALITHDDRLLGDIELPILKAATQHHAHTRYLLRTVPGIGELLSLVLLYETRHIGASRGFKLASHLAAS
jgi:uncharacterized protein (DUF779 family)